MLRCIDEQQGIGIYTKNLMDHLLPLDKSNEYVLFYRTPEFLGRYARYHHVKEKLVQAPNKAIWDQIKIPFEASRENVDIIFNTKFTVPFLTRRRTLMVLHGSAWFVHPKCYKAVDRTYINLMMRLYCHKAHRIISNSNMTKRDFVRILGVPKDKIKTTYFGFDPRFRPVDDDIYLKTIKDKYQLPERFILYVGRIDPGKNFGALIEAFDRIHESLPHKIVVAGQPRWGYHGEYARVAQLGLQDKFLFLGWVPQEDLVAFYNLADVFVFPSFYEGFGIPLLEAMACGCPAIASRGGALPEIADGGALLVDPYNSDDIAAAVRKVLSDESLRRELAEKGRQRAKAFSWERCASETLELFEALHHEAA